MAGLNETVAGMNPLDAGRIHGPGAGPGGVLPGAPPLPKLALCSPAVHINSYSQTRRLPISQPPPLLCAVEFWQSTDMLLHTVADIQTAIVPDGENFGFYACGGARHNPARITPLHSQRTVRLTGIRIREQEFAARWWHSSGWRTPSGCSALVVRALPHSHTLFTAVPINSIVTHHVLNPSQPPCISRTGARCCGPTDHSSVTRRPPHTRGSHEAPCGRIQIVVEGGPLTVLGLRVRCAPHRCEERADLRRGAAPGHVHPDRDPGLGGVPEHRLAADPLPGACLSQPGWCTCPPRAALRCRAGPRCPCHPKSKSTDQPVWLLLHELAVLRWFRVLRQAFSVPFLCMVGIYFAITNFMPAPISFVVLSSLHGAMLLWVTARHCRSLRAAMCFRGSFVVGCFLWVKPEVFTAIHAGHSPHMTHRLRCTRMAF